MRSRGAAQRREYPLTPASSPGDDQSSARTGRPARGGRGASNEWNDVQRGCFSCCPAGRRLRRIALRRTGRYEIDESGNMSGRPSADNLAIRVLDLTAGADADSIRLVEVTGQVLLRLRELVARLVGLTGCDLLISRAINLAAGTRPVLTGVRWSGDPPGLEGLAERARDHQAEEVRAACVAVVGGFLSLLFSFIGEDLTQRQVHRAWPEVLLDPQDPGTHV